MRITLLLFLIILTSCNSDKVIELPEIQQAVITELTDISPAYLFYDETQPDSLELNRKNLISTTNWVVNVDKRLTLQQVIPKIQFLQEKKNSSSHKNEAAKNYYTCHDLSQNNLGFIEFTNINYHIKNSVNADTEIEILVESVNKITIRKTLTAIISVESSLKNLVSDLNHISTNEAKVVALHLKNTLSFQDYITLKDTLTALESKDFVINNNEFIY